MGKQGNDVTTNGKDTSLKLSKLKRNPKHGEVLRDFMNSKTPKLKIYEVADAIGKSRGAVNRLLSKDVFTKSDILLLDYATDLSIEDFTKDIDPHESKEEYGEFRKPTRLKVSQGHSANTLFQNFKHSSKDEDKLAHYFNIVTGKINSTTKSLFIYDYLGWKTGAKLRNDETFTEKNEEYLASIEHLANRQPNAEYHRILALPIDYIKHDPIISYFSKAGLDDATLYTFSVIRLIFKNSFKHLLESYVKFEDRFFLYVLGSTTQKFSYMLVDNTSILIQTLSHDPHSSLTELDNLFVHSMQTDYHDPDIERMINDYKSKFILLTQFAREQNVIRKISLGSFESLGKSYEAQLKQTIDQIKQMIKLNTRSKKFTENIVLEDHIELVRQEQILFKEKMEIYEGFVKRIKRK